MIISLWGTFCQRAFVRGLMSGGFCPVPHTKLHQVSYCNRQSKSQSLVVIATDCTGRCTCNYHMIVVQGKLGHRYVMMSFCQFMLTDLVMPYKWYFTILCWKKNCLDPPQCHCKWNGVFWGGFIFLYIRHIMIKKYDVWFLNLSYK